MLRKKIERAAAGPNPVILLLAALQGRSKFEFAILGENKTSICFAWLRLSLFSVTLFIYYSIYTAVSP
jgi:hypothetical protein